MHFSLDTAFATVVTLIINILSVPVNLQQIFNWTTIFILWVWKVRHNRWLFEAWGHLAGTPLGTGTDWKVEGIVTGHKMTTTESGARPHHLSIFCSPCRALHPCSAPGSLLRSTLGWLTLPWRRPGVKATWLCSIHRDVAPPPPGPALLSVLGWEWGDFGQIPTFFTLSHLKWFAPQIGAGSKRYCAPLFIESANGEDLLFQFLLNEWSTGLLQHWISLFI